jgi:XTP/dITP diphosphohydrolase
MKSFRELVIATTNPGKLREIRELLGGLPIKVTCLKDYPGAPPVVEDGTTFEENAAKKATAIARFTGKVAMGEDSGLEVKALGGKPGIYSARFSGEGATDRKNNLQLLRALKGLPLTRRQARYRCCAVISDGKEVWNVVNGTCSGLIALHPKGKNGFGYDPLFFLPQYGKTFGELDPSVKARISHRARALRKLKIHLSKWCGSRR